MEKVRKYMEGFGEYTKFDLLAILALSFLRYCIFSFQFYWLLILMGVTVPLGEGLIMIALTFIALSLIPTIIFTEIGVRGSAALLFIGLLSSNTTGIISASFVLWLVNIAIPAIMGIPFVFQLKFFDRDR